MASVEDFRTYPERLAHAVEGLDLSRPTREGGWSLAKMLIHLADAQTIAFYRMKWILSTDSPTLIGFDQDRWSAMPDSSEDFAADAVGQVKSLYRRWYAMLSSLSEEDWGKKGVHEELGEISLRDIFEYFWKHGEDHLRTLEKLSG